MLSPWVTKHHKQRPAFGDFVIQAEVANILVIIGGEEKLLGLWRDGPHPGYDPGQSVGHDQNRDRSIDRPPGNRHRPEDGVEPASPIGPHQADGVIGQAVETDGTRFLFFQRGAQQQGIQMPWFPVVAGYMLVGHGIVGNRSVDVAQAIFGVVPVLGPAEHVVKKHSRRIFPKITLLRAQVDDPSGAPFGDGAAHQRFQQPPERRKNGIDGEDNRVAPQQDR